MDQDQDQSQYFNPFNLGDVPLPTEAFKKSSASASVEFIFDSMIPDLGIQVAPISLAEFSDKVSVALKAFCDFALTLSFQRILKLNKLQEVFDHISIVTHSFDDLDRVVDETKLIALNTLIGASKCGWSGESFAGVVKQVNALCNQSQYFLKELKGSVETSQAALHQVLSVINKTIESEVNVCIILKGHVDFRLGKLQAHDDYLSVLHSDRWSMMDLSDHDKMCIENAMFEHVVQDLDALKQIFVATVHHLLSLKEKYHLMDDQENNLPEILEKLVLLGSASVRMKQN